jgi:predicted nucleic acid-binding Zn ribbon protein
MEQVDCLYCGRSIPDDAAVCPGCGAPSHFQRRGHRPGARRRFLLWFGLLAAGCLALALWLPR